jgi:hypothetical protein
VFRVRIQGTYSGFVSAYRHAQQSWFVMLQDEVLIRKGSCAIDASRTSAIAVQEITSLDHEVFDLQLATGD